MRVGAVGEVISIMDWCMSIQQVMVTASAQLDILSVLSNGTGQLCVLGQVLVRGGKVWARVCVPYDLETEGCM